MSIGDGLFMPLYPPPEGIHISPLDEANMRNSQLFQGNPEAVLSTSNGVGFVFKI